MDWKAMVKAAQEAHARRPLAGPVDGSCIYCGVSMGIGHAWKMICKDCGLKRFSVANRANYLTNKAVRAGLIPRADTLTCVDCGKPAQCWDHRDYTKPLEVEPTCRACNKARGPAEFRGES